ASALAAPCLACTSSAPAAGLSSFALAAGADSAVAAPSSMIASTCWLVTVSPSLNLISLSTPSTGEGTSSTTLSVSRSTRFSSRVTASPAFLCQPAMVASETDSGRTGTLTSVAMGWRPWGVEDGAVSVGDLVAGRIDQRIGDQLELFLDVVGEMADGRRGRAAASGVAQGLALVQATLQVVLDLVPGALV